MQFQQSGTVVAELWCHDFGESLAFYVDRLGFSIGQHKEGSTHAYLVLGQSVIMISHYDTQGVWNTGPFEKPLGRGINFSFFVDDVRGLYDRFAANGVTPHIDLYDIWYWRPARMENYRECAVLDPDGYMLRLSQMIGHRPHDAEDAVR